MRYFALAGPFL